MRIIFMGTPDFAVPSLHALIASGHEILAVYSQPPRAAGRGMKLQPSPVQRLAKARGVQVLTPASLNSSDEHARFCALKPDAAVIVAYGLILPAPILQAPRHGCFNVHASLLPRWRGAAPIQRAIMAGDAKTGISIMRMEEGLDTGDVCMEREVPIPPEMTAGALHDALAVEGAGLMVEALARAEAGELHCTPQPESGVTYAHKLGPADFRIFWTEPAQKIHDQIRALSPRPGAWFELHAGDGAEPERVKVLRAVLASGEGTPGTLLDDRLTIACGIGALRLIEVQRAGKRPMPAEEFLRGLKLSAGGLLHRAPGHAPL